MPPVHLRQANFQWFQDDAPPSSNSPVRSENSNLAAIAPGTHVLLRVQTQFRGPYYFSLARRLEYRAVGTNVWHSLGAMAVPPYEAPVCCPSTWFVDGDPITTQRLSPPTYATSAGFRGGEAKQTETATDPIVYGSNQFSEDLWSLWVHLLAPAGLDLEFRVTREGYPFERYLLYPRLTVAGYRPTVMDVQANQLRADARPLAKLAFKRDRVWWDLSDRLVFPLTITRRLKAVTTADLSLDNADGLLARENRVSSWNYDVTSTYDPLLDEGRVVRIQQGAELHPNLAYGLSYDCGSPPPTRPASLLGTELTDGGFGQPGNERDDSWVGWQGVPVTVTFSLSPARDIHSAAVSFLTRSAKGVRLPSSVSITLIGSGGTHTAPLPVDHLRDDPGGRRHHVYGLDLNQSDVSQVIFHFYPQSEEAWIEVDEIALHDAASKTDYLRTTFTGILGDDITQHASDRGTVRLGQVRDMTKRLADLFVEVYDHYAGQSVEEIVEHLLTEPRYEAALDACDYALDATGFILPKWTEQNASVLDACAQLAKMIGWVFEADETGVYRLYDLEWDTHTGEETYLAGRDLLEWQATVSGINLRNRIAVKSRDARNQELAVTVQDAESIARYGPRLFTLFEPTTRTARLARRLASSVLRDYGWVQRSGYGVAAGDVFLRPGRVVTVVHSGCTHSGADQLYRVEGVVHRQTGHRHGQYTMSLELQGYRHRVPSAPDSLVAHPRDSAMELDWAPELDELSVIGYRVLQSGSMTGSYTQVATTAAPPIVIEGLTNAQTYWFEVGGYTDTGGLGELAGPVPCAPQSGGDPTSAEAAWQPQSLTAQLLQIWGASRPNLHWRPAMPSPPGTCYNVYRSQVSTGPFALVATRTQFGPLLVAWTDFETDDIHGDLHYQVTFYDPRADFESLPSSTAQVELP